ncbi:MAG: 30S ribosomal protein S16 [Deltaproteobacteria bacterium GWC2_42_11]|nr:MAG: 30S ribosomal protein S16 [Deltaproteobacteria bacterium GWC2_42_11]HBO84279.1 30S ribosomal protein S16 [Deltaproteobacteria bacterium]
MGVKIRLTRIGAKKKPVYRIVVADSNSPRDGKFLEVIGSYDPNANPAKVDIDEEVTLKWLNRGATPTETVKNLIKRTNILDKFARGSAT